VHLTEQERGERIAGGLQVVAGRVVPCRSKLKLPAVPPAAQPCCGKLWCRNSKPVLSVCRPLTHVRSFENCHRSFFSKPNRGHPSRPMDVYGTLPPLNRIVGGPASCATMPPVGFAVPCHSRCGQFAPAER
jgi:hypothetical protein